MARHGSPLFESYTRNIRRIYWSDFIDAQLEAARPQHYKASIIEDSIREPDNIATALAYHRHRFAPAAKE